MTPTDAHNTQRRSMLVQAQYQPADDDFQIQNNHDTVKPNSGGSSCSSSLPRKLVLLFTLKCKTHFACSQIQFFFSCTRTDSKVDRM